MRSAGPTLEQLKSVQLEHKAEITNHAWQQLLDLLLHLQARLPEGGIAQLLLLLHLEHAQSAQQLGEAAAERAGVPSSEAAQAVAAPGSRLADLPGAAAAAVPGDSWNWEADRTGSDVQESAHPSLMWHHQQQGWAV